MENKQNHQSRHADDGQDKELNANSAYSGSGSMQPGRGSGVAGKPSDYPDGNLDEVKQVTESIPGNQTDRPAVKDSDPTEK